ncbi:MAG TPA: glycosyltransferase family 2 protein [Synechococcales cyanobacterium M55_K2018_004]|nr:glycosyltransferase family 2 protein [Synechococcales cyanobacterium M55_K2018_004]
MQTPIALIIFKRPSTTEKVFQVIRQAQPTKLFVIANAPREGNEEEAIQCEQARAIVERVDWDCQVFKRYSPTHNPVGKQIAGGIDWVFEQVEEAIFIEDDCLLHPTFFPFCEAMLDRYRNDTRIFSVSAQNTQMGHRRTEYSYYFSRYARLWGWASWRRAWHYYDYSMKYWPEVQRTGLLHNILEDSRSVQYWTDLFDRTYRGEIQTWDYQWTLSYWLQSGLSIVPEVNLVNHIGFGPDASHLQTLHTKTAAMPMAAMEFPLKHPPYVVRHVQADRFTQRVDYEGGWVNQVKNTVKRMLRVSA